MAVLRGFQRSVTQDNLNLYTEYLVVNDNQENDVAEIIKSKLIPDAYYVKYKLPFEEERLRARIQNRPTLNNM